MNSKTSVVPKRIGGVGHLVEYFGKPFGIVPGGRKRNYGFEQKMRERGIIPVFPDNLILSLLSPSERNEMCLYDREVPEVTDDVEIGGMFLNKEDAANDYEVEPGKVDEEKGMFGGIEPPVDRSLIEGNKEHDLFPFNKENIDKRKRNGFSFSSNSFKPSSPLESTSPIRPTDDKRPKVISLELELTTLKQINVSSGINYNDRSSNRQKAVNHYRMINSTGTGSCQNPNLNYMINRAQKPQAYYRGHIN